MRALPLCGTGACIRRIQLAGAISGTHTGCLCASSYVAGLAHFQSSAGPQKPPTDTTNEAGRKRSQDPPNPTQTSEVGQPTADASSSSTPTTVSGSGASNETPKTQQSAASSPLSSFSPGSTAQASPSSTSDNVNTANPSGATNTNDKSNAITTPEPEPVRWVQPTYQDPDTLPIVDERGEYIVSRVQWPTGEIAYRTPAPTDDKLAPRFGYNVVQVRKHVSWWKYNQKYPRLSLAYINIQVLFLLGLAWLVAFLTTEYRNVTEAMRTPGAMVGEHRGKGPATNQTQKVTFEKDEMAALMDKAQNNWYDGKAEASYVGSKEYKMKKIPRPKEFSVEDFRKR